MSLLAVFSVKLTFHVLFYSCFLASTRALIHSYSSTQLFHPRVFHSHHSSFPKTHYSSRFFSPASYISIRVTSSPRQQFTFHLVLHLPFLFAFPLRHFAAAPLVSLSRASHPLSTLNKQRERYSGVIGHQTDVTSPVLVTLCVNWLSNAFKLHL